MPGISATEEALSALRRLASEHGQVMFFLSGGCCDGSLPICLDEGELLVGPNDLLLGEVAGALFYIDAELFERWRRPDFVLDVAAGSPEGMSLGTLDGRHFVTQSSAPEADASG